MPGHKEEIGRALREARQSAGLSLRQIADAIRIKPIYLQAIEAGQFELLPALPQTVGFTRSYAKFLDVDVEQPLSRLGEEVHRDIEQADYSEPELPWTQVSGTRMAYVAVGAVIGCIAVGAFVFDFDFSRGEIIHPVIAEPDLPPSLLRDAQRSQASRAPVVIARDNGIEAGRDPVAASAPAGSAPSSTFSSVQGTSSAAGGETTALAAPAPSVSAMEAAPDIPAADAAQTALSAPETAPAEAASPAPASPAVPAEETAAVMEGATSFATGSVYLRAAPRNSGRVVGILNRCEPLRLIGDDAAGHWHQVGRADGTTGWVYRRYVTGKTGACS